jgi:hypothetical protein
MDLALAGRVRPPRILGPSAVAIDSSRGSKAISSVE